MSIQVDFGLYLLGRYEGLGRREEKHLPTQHDQKKHAGNDAAAQADDIIGSRTDMDSDWAELKLRRPTNEELLDVFGLGESIPIIMDIDTFRDEDGDLQINLRGQDRTNDQTHFTRRFMIGEGGDPIVIHDGFSISGDDRQKGIGSTLLEKSESLYKKMGVKSIHLIANSSVGIYAWARMGFDFGNSHARRLVVDNFYSYLDVHEIPKSEWPASAEHAWEIAAWKSTAKSMYSGKDYLLGDAYSWNAVKYLDDDDEGYKIGQLYYRLKRGQGK